MIQVVNRAIDILEYIAKEKDKVYSLSEIADELGLNHGTTANILKTLVSRNYVIQKSHKKGYQLGPMTYYISGNMNYHKELVDFVRSPMQELSEKIKETCILTIMQGDKRITLHIIESKHELHVRNQQVKKASDSSTGRLMLAFMEVEDQKQFIKRYGLPSKEIWKGISSENQLLDALEEIKKNGMGLHTSSQYITGISYPIFSQEKIIASLGVYLPDVRFKGMIKEKIISETKKAATTINDLLEKNNNIDLVKKIS